MTGNQKRTLLIALDVLFVLLAIIISFGYHAYCNNWNETTDSYTAHSFAVGLGGHIEYVVYGSGMQDVKVYPSWGHRYTESTFYQDSNGDGLVDFIRINGPEYTYHSLEGAYERSEDYDAHREEFQEGDRILQNLMKKYKNV